MNTRSTNSADSATPNTISARWRFVAQLSVVATIVLAAPTLFAQDEEPTEPSDLADTDATDTDATDTDATGTGETQTGANPVPPTDANANGALRLDPIEVWGDLETYEELGGAVTIVDEEDLDAFEEDDPSDVFNRVPGVYVRSEDGFGLRPNIGMRGVNSDRSAKLTLMDDGVLFGPAPYAAPAAYYFPLMARMVGVEVFRGPAGVLFGPNTIGGAINLLSRPIPESSEGAINASIGSYLTNRLLLHYGDSNERMGFLAEALHIGSNGFKELDSPGGSDADGGDTGFSRLETLLRGRWNSDPYAPIVHGLELRLGYSREVSHETYLGLTDDDYAANPNRRYIASANDRMAWDRTEARVSYTIAAERLSLRTTLYRHDFSRTWLRADRIEGASGTLYDLLGNPNDPLNSTLIDILRGDEDGTGLQLVSNARSFTSQGVQSIFRADGPDGDITWNIEAGVRLHADRVDRDHIYHNYDITGGELVDTGVRTDGVDSTARATAVATHIAPTIGIGSLTVAPGVRFEHIRTSYDDHLPTDADSPPRSQGALIPGIGLNYDVDYYFSVFAGAHRGFSPVAPSAAQDENIQPESSINYEAGLRWLDGLPGFNLELVGFFNDYNNLLGDCAAGCSTDSLDRQFNGGEVDVFGAEFSADYTAFVGAFEVPIALNYTLTQSSFQTAFTSTSPQFGTVEIGDELPYLPEHQLSFTTGLAHWRWGVNVGATYVAAMRETAGSETDALSTDPFLSVDGLAYWFVRDDLRVYASIDNALNAQPIVSRRPFGARPPSPLLAMIGAEWKF